MSYSFFKLQEGFSIGQTVVADGGTVLVWRRAAIHHET
jgi:hypothetical protein